MDDFDRASNNSSDEGDELNDDNAHEQEPMDVDDNPQEDDDDNDGNDDDDNDNDNDDDDDDNNENEDRDDDDDDEKQHHQTGDNPTVTRTSATPASPSPKNEPSPLQPTWQPKVRAEYLNAHTYDIVPTMAAPMATSINAISITPCLRYWMTGGSDGYIRKYHGPDTLNGKTLLTVAQRHPFVDSVTKAGVLMSYWENAEPPAPGARAEDTVLSPVYSLAVHSQALWLLSGLESGGINLQSVRHDEGKRIHCLQKHTNAVSVLQLSADEKSVLSGSWDKNIYDWDLNYGTVTRSFDGSGHQVSALEVRPMGGAPFPAEAGEVDIPQSDTMFGDNHLPDLNGDANFKTDDPFGGDLDETTNGFDLNGLPDAGANGNMDGQGSPAHDSLFGGSPTAGDDLFGDNDGMGAFDGDDDNEFSRAMMQDSAQDPGNGPMGDFDMSGTGFDSAPAVQPPQDGSSGQADGMQDSSLTVDGIHDSSNDLGDLNMLTDNNDSGPPMPDFSMPTEGGDPSLSSQPMIQDSQQTGTEPAASDPTNQQPQEQHRDHQQGGQHQQPEEAPPSPSILFAAPAPSHHDTSQTSDSTFLSASIDGSLKIWDRRVPNPVARIGNRPGVPPWCMGAAWSVDGNAIYAGRRNGTVEEFDIHRATRGWSPSRVFKFPAGSGPISCVRPMANGRHLVCASHDILRLYSLQSGTEQERQERTSKHAPPPFLIVPGPPRAGVISSLYVDPSNRFMISAAGNRGWEGTNTEVLIGYEINVPERQ